MITYRRMNSNYDWVNVTEAEYVSGIAGDPEAPNNRGHLYKGKDGAIFVTLEVANVSPGDLTNFLTTSDKRA